jgi:sulfur-carrier protein adenylyltransferase/sulfurtransferase
LTHSISEISVVELDNLLKADEAFFLLDVREPSEGTIGQIPASIMIPLGQIAQRLAELPKDVPIVVYCHHGGRSAKAAQFLQEQGFTDVRNLRGGIDAWSLEIDPDVARY